ncbi:hydrophobic W protein [Promicromonospora thailandica]|uniref:Hydrophobic W protein n=1 Tax=Promicromonospora thailandica TaxID=765201 RepID=A0A9X2G4G7_9MICO|nr:hydrophobic W protein [Promicromonospora thailandica]BFF19774.1 hypothetical protein GCM10025730_32950 [Promicromonospora thailandica]
MLVGAALVATTLVPVPAAAAGAELPPPTGIALNGQACGAEPVTIILDGARRLTVRATFDDPAVTRARVELMDAAGGLEAAGDVSVVDGALDIEASVYGLTDNDVNSVVVRARSADGAQTGPALGCAFLLRYPAHRGPSVLPVIGADAVYAAPDVPRGGLGVRGAFLITGPVSADAKSFAYGVTTSARGEPASWTTVPAGENVVVPVLPTSTGVQHLQVVEIDETGLRSPMATRSFDVAASGGAQAAPPAVSVAEPQDPQPGDGLVPLDLTLTADLPDSSLSSVRDEVTLYAGTTEVARTRFDTRTKSVLVSSSLLGTGFRDLRVEYTQYPGATPVSRTARICASACSYSGGTATVVSRMWSGDRSHPSYNAYYEARGSRFSPTAASYTYQWLRDGVAIKGATRKEYLSPPADVGRRVAVRVTAHGPRMKTRSVTSTPFTVRSRDGMHVEYGALAVGGRWENRFCYCTTEDGDVLGRPGSGRAIQALMARPGSRTYITSVLPPAADGSSSDVALWFEMKGYVQGRGWEGLKRKDTVRYVGSVGENRRLEAFRIAPAGPLAASYDVWYRAYVPRFGWLGWAKNGESAGATRFGYRIEAVQIRVLPRGTRVTASGSGNAPYYDKGTQNQVSVRPYFRQSGWKPGVVGGLTSGYPSTTQRLNALRVRVDGTYAGGVQVSAKVQGSWRPYVGNNQVAGTYHQAKGTSAYKMRLTGEMAKRYDLYYRVHVAGVGWLGWARNGAAAGSTSSKPRATAVQVVLVKKGGRTLMSAGGRAAYRY